MKYLSLFVFVVVFTSTISLAKEKPGKELSAEDSLMLYDAIINATFNYQHGDVKIGDGMVTLHIPEGYKYLDAAQSKKVLVDYWGNPDADGTLGMIFPEESGPMDRSVTSWAFNLRYDEIGYVEDSDAEDINYDELLEQMQKESVEENIQRAKLGYKPMYVVRWAISPYYDKNRRVLHWAEELQVGDSVADEHTLNYRMRVLGRKGVFELNAIGLMSSLSGVQSNLDKTLGMVEFNPGYKYEEYDSGVDKVAAYTLGGLVAGKVLAKVGFFAVIAKFAKFIIVGLVAAGGAIWRFLTGRSKQQDSSTTTDVSSSSDNNSL